MPTTQASLRLFRIKVYGLSGSPKRDRRIWSVLVAAPAVALLLIWVWRGKHVCLNYNLTNSSQTEYTDVVLSVGKETYFMGSLRNGDERIGSLCCGVADHWGLRLRRVDAGVTDFVFLDGCGSFG